MEGDLQKVDVLLVFNLAEVRNTWGNGGVAPRIRLLLQAAARCASTTDFWTLRRNKENSCPCLKPNPVPARYSVFVPTELSELTFILYE